MCRKYHVFLKTLRCHSICLVKEPWEVTCPSLSGFRRGRGVAWNGHYFIAVIYARDTCVVLGTGEAGRSFSLGLGRLEGGSPLGSGTLLGGCTWQCWARRNEEIWWGKCEATVEANELWVRMWIRCECESGYSWWQLGSMRNNAEYILLAFGHVCRPLAPPPPSLPHTMLPSWVDHFQGGE